MVVWSVDMSVCNTFMDKQWQDKTACYVLGKNCMDWFLQDPRAKASSFVEVPLLPKEGPMLKRLKAAKAWVRQEGEAKAKWHAEHLDDRWKSLPPSVMTLNKKFAYVKSLEFILCWYNLSNYKFQSNRQSSQRSLVVILDWISSLANNLLWQN